MPLLASDMQMHANVHGNSLLLHCTSGMQHSAYIYVMQELNDKPWSLQSRSILPKGIVIQISTWDRNAFLLPCDVDQYCKEENSILLFKTYTRQYLADLL